MTRRDLLQSAVAVCAVPTASVDCTFWVLRLLYPRELRVLPVATARLHCRTVDRDWVVEGSASVLMKADALDLSISGPGGAPVDFVLDAGVYRRRYRGVLRLRTQQEVLRALLTMDCETAASSIVGAELPVSIAPQAALMAQAIASRSVLRAQQRWPRHADADFCDTTHCQFLRAPAEHGSPVEQAVQGSRGMVLRQGERIVNARYSAACGGMTEAGVVDGTRYAAAPCAYCRAAGLARQGHGWGLCQQGAMAMARAGCSAVEILAKYYPGTLIDTAC